MKKKKSEVPAARHLHFATLPLCHSATASLLAAALSALALRLAPFGQVLTPEGALPSGTDAYHHLRRAAAALADGFSIPHRDLYCHFPGGIVDPWPPLFDWLLAAVTLVFGGADASPETLATVSVLVPPVLGAIAVILLYALARRVVGRAGALSAAWVYAVIPAACYRTLVGAVDHHALEVLLALAVLALLAGEARARPRAVVRSVGLGLALAAAVLTWLGAIVFAGLAFCFLAFLALRRAGTAEGAATASFAVRTFVVGGCVLLPFAFTTIPGREGDLRLYHLTALQPLLFAAAAVAAGILRWAHGWIAGGARPRGRALAVVAVTGLAVTVGLAWTPAGAGLAEGFGFARRATPVLLLPLESRPLFFPISGFDPSMAWLLFGVAGPAAVLGAGRVAGLGAGRVAGLGAGRAAGLGAGRAARRSARRVDARVLLLLVFGAFLSLALFQVRFTHLLAIPVAVLAGGLAAAMGRRWGRPVGVVFTVLVLVAPAAVIQTTRFGPTPPPASIRAALTGLRQTSPPVSATAPEYGVVAVWDLGHWINWFAGRPALDSMFLHLAPLEPTARFFLAESENEADALADRYRIRFAVSVPIPASPVGGEAADAGLYRYLYPRQFIQVAGQREADYLEIAPGGLGITPRFGRTLQFRLQYLDGVRPPRGRHPAFRGLDPEVLAAPTLRGWRLHLAADDPDRPGEGGRIKVFERVRGARLTGELVPNAEVQVFGMVRTPLGDRYAFVFSDQVRAGADGRFSIRVPYWTRTGADAVGVDGGFVLAAPAIRWRRQVEVREADVRAGLEVPVP